MITEKVKEIPIKTTHTLYTFSSVKNITPKIKGRPIK